jgi:sortase B
MTRKKDWLSALLIAACVLAILACSSYLLYNYLYLPRKIHAQNQRYAELYAPSQTPSAAPDNIPTPAPSNSPEPEPTAAIAAIPASPEPSTDCEPLDIALGTPGPDTVVLTVPPPPPSQQSFADLLTLNSETVGFLRSGDIALPVVQRLNDNFFYLDHDFEGNESAAGCLFLDGVNRLYPGDQCLYVYGHNMKNGSMFGKLTNFCRVDFLKQNPIVRFDTIYRDGEYVPFACFTLAADQSSADYFNLRSFVFTEESFNEYVAALKARSLIMIPVDVKYGDELLVLVTCNYSIDDGRFVVACRRLRDGETDNTIRALTGQAQPN